MREHIYIVFFLLFLNSSCQSNQNSYKLPTNQTTIIKYSSSHHLDSSKNKKAKLSAGWIDSFKIDGQKFRIKLDEDSGLVFIEYFKNNQWLKNTSLDIYDQFETEADCNYDGFNDISSESQGWTFVNSYNPSKKEFSKQYKVPGDYYYLLDTSHKLFVNFREPYHQCNAYDSQLFDYKNAEPNVYFLLSGETYTNKNGCITDSIKIIKLYKYNPLKDALILLEKYKPTNPKKFDYTSFWKENYKRLMGYK